MRRAALPEPSAAEFQQQIPPAQGFTTHRPLQIGAEQNAAAGQRRSKRCAN
jgi:hypothetical protein